MTQRVTVGLVVIALSGAASCARFEQADGRPGRQAAVVLEVRMDENGACKLRSQTPPALETAPGRNVFWFVVGECADVPVAIAWEVTQNGQPYLPFDKKSSLSNKAPPPGGPGAYVLLQGIIRKDATAGSYKYQVLINGEAARYNPTADRGEFEICPKWPCEGRLME